ncbi:MAG TPA: DUF6264 family protein [Agromyces sp.]|nr:DUF6264 family protein [Agromyces sp.]
MSQHGAARPSDESDGGAARGVPPVPRDERPRPQYGEYAPEGWTWKPPAGERTSDPAPQMATPPAAASARPRSTDGRPERPADRFITIMLLVIGVFGTWSTISTLQSLPDLLPDAIRRASEMLGTSAAAIDYTPGPEVPAILLAGSIFQVVLWLLTAWWSISRIRARRLAFWVPLIGGAVSFIALYAVMFIVILGDPALVAGLSGS